MGDTPYRRNQNQSEDQEQAHTFSQRPLLVPQSRPQIKWRHGNGLNNSERIAQRCCISLTFEGGRLLAQQLSDQFWGREFSQTRIELRRMGQGELGPMYARFIEHQIVIVLFSLLANRHGFTRLILSRCPSQGRQEALKIR